MKKTKATNEFETFLSECNAYVWEWYLPEQFVRFGIPSLNGLWIDDKEKIFKLTTVLERVHPDDVDKIFVRRTSPIYKSDKMFEIDLRLNLNGHYEWYGFRGKTLKRDKYGRPTYLRGIAINVDSRVRVQRKLLSSKDYLLQNEKQKTDYCSVAVQEIVAYVRSMATDADAVINDELVTREERLAKFSHIKEQLSNMLEMTDKIRHILGNHDVTLDKDIKKLSLWEHLAELQQVYALKKNTHVPRLYFSNLYDDLSIMINVKLFDMLIENVINLLTSNVAVQDYLTISYVKQSDDTLRLEIAAAKSMGMTGMVEPVVVENSLSLSVCRLFAKRLWGHINVVSGDGNKIQCVITLPMDAHKASGQQSIKLDVYDEIDKTEQRQVSEPALPPSVSGLPQVLIAVHTDTTIFKDQHLFNVVFAQTTDEVIEVFKRTSPQIVYVDNNLRGTYSTLELVEQLRALSVDVPIIVSADYANRLLHRKVRSIGAQYLITNPLTLRKVNLMIKKYLK